MERKVNKVGKNTLTVSLPTQWTKQNGITKASSLFLEEQGSSIILSVGGDIAPRCIEIDMRKRGAYAKKHIIQAYKKGYDEIKVFYDSSQTLQDLTTVLGVLIGFEIIEQQENFVIFKNMAKELDDDIGQLTERAVAVTSRMVRCTKDAFATNDLELVEQVIRSEQINNRLCLLSERIIAKQGYAKNYLAGAFIMVFMYKLENLADDLRRICEIISMEPALLKDPAMRTHFSLVSDMYDVFLAFYKDNDATRLDGLQELRQSSLLMLEKELHGRKTVAVQYLTTIQQVIVSLYDLAGIALAIII